MGQHSKLAAKWAGNGGVRLQYAALCWRKGAAGIEVLLITSRDTGRWVIPKGWPMPDRSPEATAAREAWEEAGVEGEVNPVSLGRYGYLKEMISDPAVPCAVAVYGLQVKDLSDNFPEKAQRRRQWFPLAEGAGLVQEPDLGALIRGFTPPVEGRLPPIRS